MEPRSPDGREILETYSVVWTPKMPASAMAHLRQTNPAIVGLARLGERKGISSVDSPGTGHARAGATRVHLFA